MRNRGLCKYALPIGKVRIGAARLSANARKAYAACRYGLFTHQIFCLGQQNHVVQVLFIQIFLRHSLNFCRGELGGLVDKRFAKIARQAKHRICGGYASPGIQALLVTIVPPPSRRLAPLSSSSAGRGFALISAIILQKPHATGQPCRALCQCKRPSCLPGAWPGKKP